ncbi:sugar 3,4-ketoisomerase [Shewanella frigidimarina]|uniref:sugar 3,4-ketoisomerase n=1 Tax=Shewanella frigidimarina TaxID=56812 RepID=UPI003FA1969A
MSLINVIDFKSLGDERGELVSIENNKNIPFEIKRVYYVFKTQKGVARGFHAHKELRQVAICISGSCKFIMDNGKVKESFVLDDPQKGLYINKMQWREMHEFSDDCVLLVLASDVYDESDYIRDYADFIQMVN